MPVYARFHRASNELTSNTQARFLFAVYDGLLAEFKVVGSVVMEPTALQPE